MAQRNTYCIYTSKVFDNDCRVGLEVGKLWLSSPLVVIFPGRYLHPIYFLIDMKVIAYGSCANYSISGGHFVANFCIQI